MECRSEKYKGQETSYGSQWKSEVLEGHGLGFAKYQRHPKETETESWLTMDIAIDSHPEGQRDPVRENLYDRELQENQRPLGGATRSQPLP